MQIRPANLPDDYPGIASILTAEVPEWPTSADDLAYADDEPHAGSPRGLPCRTVNTQ